MIRVSGGCGQAGAAFGECGEGREEMGAMFGGGGEVAADGAELLGSGEGPQAPGDFLSQFDHPDFSLGGVVVEGAPRVGGEPQVVVLTVDQAAGQGVVFGYQLAHPGTGRFRAE